MADLTGTERIGSQEQDEAALLFDAVADALWLVDLETLRIEAANPAAEVLHGCGRGELQGLSPVEMSANPKRIASWLAAIGDQGSLDTSRIEGQHRSADGRVLPVELQAKLLILRGRGKLLCTVRDLSRRQRMQSSLEDSELRFRRLFENAPLGYQSMDTEGCLIEVNPAWLALTGYRRSEVVGRPFREFLAEGYDKRFCDRFRLFQRGGEIHGVELGVRRVDGSTLLIAFEGRTELDAAGDFGRTHCILFDVTERQRAEQERARLQRELHQSRKLEAIGQLAGGVAHDFNNILATILGYTGLASERFGGVEAKLAEYLRQIQVAAERGRDLVSQMLNFSREVDSNPQPLLLQPLVKDLVSLLQTTLTASITVEVGIDEATPPVMMDPVEFHQLVMNLCLNARDAMGGQGTLEIRLSSTQMLDAVCAASNRPVHGEWVEVSVKDTGVGIRPDIRESLFDPFFTTKEVGKGTGMGLAVVRSILSRHDGRVVVESEPGRGSCFRLLFRPLTGAWTPLPDRRASPPLRPPRVVGRVLLVDDEPAVTGLLTELLSDRGHEVTAVNDSREALALFAQDPDRFDLLLTDQAMPGMTGTQLASEILALKPDVPVILSTGYSEQVDAERASKMGIRRFFMKPVDTASLLRAVERLLGDTGSP